MDDFSRETHLCSTHHRVWAAVSCPSPRPAPVPPPAPPVRGPPGASVVALEAEMKPLQNYSVLCPPGLAITVFTRICE